MTESSADPPDQELIRRFRQGDRDAFVALMALGIRVGLFLLGCLPLVYAASREVKMSSLSATLATWRER